MTDEPRSHSDRPEDVPAQGDPILPDEVSFGRSGIDEAPPPLPQRWLIIGATVAASVIVTATIVGTGNLSHEGDLDLEADSAYRRRPETCRSSISIAAPTKPRWPSPTEG